MRDALSGMVVVASGLVLAALPLFMVGGLAVQIKEDLGFTEAALGAAVTIGFVFGALTAPFGGRLADRIGPRATLYLGSTMTVAALVGLGLLATGWGTLVAFLCLAGIAVAVTDPALAIVVDGPCRWVARGSPSASRKPRSRRRHWLRGSPSRSSP